MELIACPECAAPAEIQWRAVLDSTDGPIEHAKTFCLHGQWFLMPVAALSSRPLTEPRQMPAIPLRVSGPSERPAGHRARAVGESVDDVPIAVSEHRQRAKSGAIDGRLRAFRRAVAGRSDSPTRVPG
jgi:hypothetical protein